MGATVSKKRVLTPAIMIAAGEQPRLTRLAAAFSTAAPEVSEYLSRELERARVVKMLTGDVVGMGCWVSYRDEATSKEQEVQLVYPEDADIAARRVSVMTPVGAALLGVASGKSITFYTRDGQARNLTILSVRHD